jgi:hypothetical protein
MDLSAGERLVLELRGLLAEARIARERRLAELEALAGFDVETLIHDAGAAPGASS